jgi:hypothetical protein
MEAARDITTRSHSSLGDYIPMIQRKPKAGEFVRVRTTPDKKKYDNIHTHGCVTVKVEECSEKKPEGGNKDELEYVIRGSLTKTSKTIFLLLVWKGEDDALDYRYRQGWDVIDEGTNPDEDERHGKRIINHIN